MEETRDETGLESEAEEALNRGEGEMGVGDAACRVRQWRVRVGSLVLARLLGVGSEVNLPEEQGSDAKHAKHASRE